MEMFVNIVHEGTLKYCYSLISHHRNDPSVHVYVYCLCASGPLPKKRERDISAADIK